MQNVITIDGPSASGKGTVAARVAAKLGWHYLDSGALYRLTALYAHRLNISWTNEAAVAALAAALPAHFDGEHIWLDGQEASIDIRSEEISMGASTVAALPTVRTALLQRQRDFLTPPGLVTDGRDMGSVVFPNAALKIFLTADAQIRAKRRAKQLGISYQGIEFERILSDIRVRDETDTRRNTAPLRQQSDALLLDTSTLTIEESVKKVLDWYHKK